MPLNNGDILRITAKMSWLSQDMQNVYHLRAGTPSADSDANIVDDIAAGIDGIYDTIDTQLDNRLSFDSVSVYNLTADRYMGEVAFPTLTTGGDSSNKSLPGQAAALVRFPTATLGSQGRKFIPGLVVALIEDDSAILTAFRATLGNYAAAVLAGLTGSDWGGEFGNWADAISSFRPYVRAIVNTYAATQRRRRPGVGS